MKKRTNLFFFSILLASFWACGSNNSVRSTLRVGGDARMVVNHYALEVRSGSLFLNEEAYGTVQPGDKLTLATSGQQKPTVYVNGRVRHSSE